MGGEGPPLSDKGQESGYFGNVILIRLHKLSVVMDTGIVYRAGEQGAAFKLITSTILEGTEEGELTTPTNTAEKGASLLGVRGCQVYAGP